MAELDKGAGEAKEKDIAEMQEMQETEFTAQERVGHGSASSSTDPSKLGFNYDLLVHMNN